jgi:uncharacterized protein YlxP (DUF503 family)
MPADDIDPISGKTNPHILLIAPHGHRQNDVNTGLLVRSVQQILDCPAIINETFRKPLKKRPADLKNKRLDFNIISHAKLHPSFLKKIKAIIEPNGRTLVLWIHGLAEDSALSEGKVLIKKKLLNGKAEDLHALIGYGQGNDPNTGKGGSCFSAPEDTVRKFADLLTSLGMTSKLTRADAPNFRGRDPNRMNQWFNNQKYPLSKVESIQIEIKEAGFRDSKENIAKTTGIIEKAVCKLWPASTNSSKEIIVAQPSPDGALVERSLGFLKDIFTKHFHEAMLEAGEYIIEEFFAGNHELARNPRNAVKIESLNQLIKRLQEDDGKAPSKTWVYDAVKLAVDEHYFSKINFRTYGKLGHSHKVYLTHVKNLEAKRELILEVVENNYTVARTRERIAEVQGHDLHEKFSLDSVPTDADLEKAGRDDLIRLRKEALSKFEFHRDKMAHYQGCLDAITKALKTIASKRGTPIGKVIELGPRGATEPEQKDQKREQGII